MLTNCTQVEDEAVRLVTAHQTMLKVSVAALIHDHFLAEDVLSEVKLAIFESWYRYDPNRPFETWARGILFRVALATLRKIRRQPKFFSFEVMEEMGVELDASGEPAELADKKLVLRGCILQLKPRHAELIHDRYFEDRSYDEISDKVGRTVKNLHVIFHRLHEILGTCILDQLTHL